MEGGPSMMVEDKQTMAEETLTPTAPASPARSKDEVALELMKFVAVSTGFGRGTSGAGFSGKSGGRTPEEQVEALLHLFQRCRDAVGK